MKTAISLTADSAIIPKFPWVAPAKSSLERLMYFKQTG